MQEILIFKPSGNYTAEEVLKGILDFDALPYEQLPLLYTDQDIDITNVFGKEPYESHIPNLRDMARRASPPCKVFHVRSSNGDRLTHLVEFLEGNIERFQCHPYWLTPNNNQPTTQNI